MTQAKAGGCLCGAVRYSIHGPIGPAVACHCSQCRRQTGSYWISTDCADTDLVMTHDAGLAWYQASNEAKRGFCRHCGSILFWKGLRLDYTSVTAGTLDGASGVRLEKHIFVADKGEYYVIDDGLPQFEQGF